MAARRLDAGPEARGCRSRLQLLLLLQKPGRKGAESCGGAPAPAPVPWAVAGGDEPRGSAGAEPGPTGSVVVASQPRLSADPLHPRPKAAGEMPPSGGGEEAPPAALPLRRLGWAGGRERGPRQVPLGATVLSSSLRLLAQSQFPFLVPQLPQRLQEVLGGEGEGGKEPWQRDGEPRSCSLVPGPPRSRSRSRPRRVRSCRKAPAGAARAPQRRQRGLAPAVYPWGSVGWEPGRGRFQTTALSPPRPRYCRVDGSLVTL